MLVMITVEVMVNFTVVAIISHLLSTYNMPGIKMGCLLVACQLFHEVHTVIPILSKTKT